MTTELELKDFIKKKKAVKRKLHTGKTVEITPWTLDEHLQLLLNIEDLKEDLKTGDGDKLSKTEDIEDLVREFTEEMKSRSNKDGD